MLSLSYVKRLAHMRWQNGTGGCRPLTYPCFTILLVESLPYLHHAAAPAPLLHPPRRMNSKLREKGKKDEGRRLREFVDTAYRLDPRVAARKEMQAAER